jgi:hypothetical protein
MSIAWIRETLTVSWASCHISCTSHPEVRPYDLVSPSLKSLWETIINNSRGSKIAAVNPQQDNPLMDNRESIAHFNYPATRFALATNEHQSS